MKKTLLSGAFLLAVIAVNAQDAGSTTSSEKKNTFELALKGTANSTWLFNTNISNIGDEQNYASAFGFNYGAAFTAYFGNVGVGIEGLYGNHKGGYAGTYVLKDSTGSTVFTSDYKSNVNLSTLEIPVLFKLKSSGGGAYLEVGPTYNMVLSADYTRTGTGMDTTMNVSEEYAKSYFGAILGFGLKFKLGDGPVGIITGLRLRYSFTDLEGVDALGQELKNVFLYPTKESTSAASGGIMLGVTYDLGKKK